MESRTSAPAISNGFDRPRSSPRAVAALCAAVLLVGAACGGGIPFGSTGPLVVSVVASALEFPWALAFVPDGRLFFTERPGRLRVVVGGMLQAAPVVSLPVQAIGEAGLLGLAADPGFATNRYLYVYYTYAGPGGPTNRIQRLVVSGTNPTTAVPDLVLLDNIPGANIHDGGRLKVGPDGNLYAAAGDAGNTALAQNTASPAGKILRLTRTGAVPPDNPTAGSYVYSLGHRNPQGLAWDSSSALYATEHGATQNDEVNHIRAGANYGWPTAQGPNHPSPFTSPIYVFTTETCAPSGTTFVTGPLIPEWSGDLLFTCLRGVHLHRLRLAGPGSDSVVSEQRLYETVYGRLRDVIAGPDGAVYFSTSNGGNDFIRRIAR
jgi:glucose/arabinose dehydrogenase